MFMFHGSGVFVEPFPASGIERVSLCAGGGNPPRPGSNAKGVMQEELAPDDPEADARLLQRARLDPQAFGILYQRFYPMILNYAFRRTLSIPAAEEVASNAFFKALRGLGKFDPGKNGSVRAWLYAIATNELRMLWRWRRRHPAMSLTELNATQRVSFD